MRIRMNKRILEGIHAILTYKRVISKKAGTEWFSETEDYFLKMSLPDTLPKSRRCLEKNIKL